MSISTSEYRKILYQYVTTAIGVLAIIFNSLEIIYIKVSRYSKRNPLGMVYILNMALSDLFVGVIMVILKSMHPYMTTTLADNDVAVEVYHIIRFCFIRFSLLVSLFNLVTLTLDRLCATRFPFFHRTKKKSFSIKVCIAIWVTSLILTSVFYCVTRFQLNANEKYKDLIFPVAVYPATVLFVCSYIAIFKVVKTTSRVAVKNRLSVQNNVGQKGKRKDPEKREELAFIRLALKAVLSFVICWIPLSTLSLMKLFNVNHGGLKVESTFFTLAILNSLLTPTVYFTHLHKAISKGFRRLISRRSLNDNNLETFSSNAYPRSPKNFSDDHKRTDATEVEVIDKITTTIY